MISRKFLSVRINLLSCFHELPGDPGQVTLVALAALFLWNITRTVTASFPGKLWKHLKMQWTERLVDSGGVAVLDSGASGLANSFLPAVGWGGGSSGGDSGSPIGFLLHLLVTLIHLLVTLLHLWVTVAPFQGRSPQTRWAVSSCSCHSCRKPLPVKASLQTLINERRRVRLR